MTSSIADTLEKLLADDKNLDTRAGLRLYAELVKDAFKYIDENKALDEATKDAITSIKTRLTNVETGLNEFLTMRSDEKKEATDERKWWRRTIMGALLVLTITELAKWLFLT